jgi:GNAT superfamily N-acetyltransferase
MNIQIYKGDAELLRKLFESRKAEMQIGKFGLNLDEVKYMAEAQKFIDRSDADMLVLFDDDTPVGYMGIEYFVSYIGDNKMANEQNWYVLPEHRGIGGIRLFQAAEIMARAKGCTHLIMNASMMASEMHDKLCSLYAKLGMSKYETSFIKEL